MRIMTRSHRIWLKTHPTRSKDWLAARVRDGFDIHHANGNHFDDSPNNLVLIECDDHQKLHGMKLDRRASSTAIRKAKRERERNAKENDFVYGSYTSKRLLMIVDDESKSILGQKPYFCGR